MVAYDALQFFHDILGSFPFSVQSEELIEWIKTCASSDVEEVRSAACTIRHWRRYIQNSWKYKKSNGLSEGLNNRIKVIKRVAFGLHSFDSLRTRVLLTCGKLRLSKDPLSILGKRQSRKRIPALEITAILATRKKVIRKKINEKKADYSLLFSFLCFFILNRYYKI